MLFFPQEERKFDGALRGRTRRCVSHRWQGRFFRDATPSAARCGDAPAWLSRADVVVRLDLRFEHYSLLRRYLPGRVHRRKQVSYLGLRRLLRSRVRDRPPAFRAPGARSRHPVLATVGREVPFGFRHACHAELEIQARSGGSRRRPAARQARGSSSRLLLPEKRPLLAFRFLVRFRLPLGQPHVSRGARSLFFRVHLPSAARRRAGPGARSRRDHGEPRLRNALRGPARRPARHPFCGPRSRDAASVARASACELALRRERDGRAGGCPERRVERPVAAIRSDAALFGHVLPRSRGRRRRHSRGDDLGYRVGDQPLRAHCAKAREEFGRGVLRCARPGCFRNRCVRRHRYAAVRSGCCAGSLRRAPRRRERRGAEQGGGMGRPPLDRGIDRALPAARSFHGRVPRRRALRKGCVRGGRSACAAYAAAGIFLSGGFLGRPIRRRARADGAALRRARGHDARRGSIPRGVRDR